MPRSPATLAVAILCLLPAIALAEPISPSWSVVSLGAPPAVVFSDQGSAASIHFTPLAFPATHSGDSLVELVRFQVLIPPDPAAGPFTFSGGLTLDVTLTDDASGKSWTGNFGFGAVGTLPASTGQARFGIVTPAIVYTAELGGHAYAIWHAVRGDATGQGMTGTLGIQVSVSQVPEPPALVLTALAAALGVWWRVRYRARGVAAVCRGQP